MGKTFRKFMRGTFGIQRTRAKDLKTRLQPNARKVFVSLILLSGGVFALFGIMNPAPARAALPAPGGVDGVSLWLKGNQGLQVNGSNQVEQWLDQSGNGLITTEARAARPTHTDAITATNDILAVPGSVNFNPSVDFSGASGRSLKGNASTSWSSTADLNIFTVASPEGPTSGTLAGTFDTNGNWTGGAATGRGLLYYNTGPSYNLDGAGCGAAPTVTSVNGFHLARGIYVSATNNLGGSTWLDGRLEKTATSSCSVQAGGSFFEIGGRTSQNFGNRIFNGKIPEVIVYKAALSTTQAQQIDSYLAVKYGMTLNQTTPTNYLASDGTTISWNGTTNAVYKNNITGIGRDDNTALNQKQSKSTNTGALVAIGNGNTIAADNASNANNFSTDKNFLIFGDDNGANNWTMIGAPTNRAKLGRTFKVQNTGSVGSVKIQVPRSTSSAATKLPAETVQVYLLTDADGDFSAGATMTPMTLTGTNFEVNATLANGTFFTFATDVLPPPHITPATDSGTSNTDGITNDTTPDFTGSCAIGQTVTIKVDNVAITPTAICDGSGNYIITPSSPIAEGGHIATASLPESGPYPFTIDTINPAPGTPDLTAGTDNGSSNTDNITNKNTPTFTGSCIDGQTVTLQVDASDITPTTICASGTYAITPDNPIADGAHNITSFQGPDIAGNVSVASSALSLVIDTVAPAVPAITNPTTGTTTNNNTPTFTGTGENGATVGLADENNTVICTAIVSGGTWSCTASAAIADGSHTFRASQTDVAGNVSAPSSVLGMTIDALPDSASSGDLSNTGQNTWVYMLIAGLFIVSSMGVIFRYKTLRYN